MKLQKKLAMALIAAGVMSVGAAHAAIEDFTTANSSILLSLVDSTTGVSALFDLGPHLADMYSNINTSGYSLSFNLAAGDYAAAYNSFITAAVPANIKWNVIAGNGVTSSYLSTTNTADSTVTGTTNTKIDNMTTVNPYLVASNTTVTGNHSTVTNGADEVNSGAGNAYFVNGFGTDKWKNNVAFVTLAAIGTAQKFWYLADNGAGTNVKGDVRAFGVDLNGDGKVGTAGEYGTWNVSSNGLVTFSNPTAVPEADTWAMFAAGLIAVGAIARRRLAA